MLLLHLIGITPLVFKHHDADVAGGKLVIGRSDIEFLMVSKGLLCHTGPPLSPDVQGAPSKQPSSCLAMDS